MAGRVMYGRDEYRYYVNRLDHERQVLTGAREAVEDLLIEYGQDTRATFGVGVVSKEAARNMIAARTCLGEAMAAIDRALSTLPKPVAA